MQTKMTKIFAAALLAALTVLAAGELRAATPLSPASSPPDRQCTVNVSGGSVDIQSGPDLSTASGLLPDTEFPVVENCPPDFAPGLCKKWVYRWIFKSQVGTAAAVSIDRDIAVFKATPTATVAPLQPFFGQGERFIRFNVPKTTTFVGTFWTPPEAGTGSATVGFIGTKGTGHCRIAGADNQKFFEQNEAKDLLVRFRIGACVFEGTKLGTNTGNEGFTSFAVETSESDPACADAGEKPVNLLSGATATNIGDLTELHSTTNSSLYCYKAATTGKTRCVTVP
jgi:hypothetical protein